MMEMRIEKVEADIAELKKDMDIVKTDIAVIKANYVAKGDWHQNGTKTHFELATIHQEFSPLHEEFAAIHQAMRSQTKLILAWIFSISGLSLGLARWLF